MSESLLPCPFCGGDELSHGFSTDYESLEQGAVQCHACGAAMIAEWEDQAVERWNTRAPTLPAWRPIAEAEFTFDTSLSPPTKWLDWCLLGRRDAHGWIEWVGGMNADEWLLRDDEGSCGACEIPTCFMPLPAPPTEGEAS